MGKREGKSKRFKNTIQRYPLEAEKITSNNFSISTQQKGLFQYSATVANVGVCHINLNTKKIHLSDKLYEIIGHKPGSFIPSLRNLFRFIYYEDKVSFFTLLSLNKVNDTFKLKNLRLVDKNGQIKHVAFKYRMIFENNEKYLVLGFTDVTEETNLAEIIAAKNEELMADNSQLLTFNQIAGHDLQDPVRKVQMFISKIKEIDDPSMSGKVSDYLQKIEDTSARMQKLVMDLLSFTNLSNASNSFVKISLQEILNEALLEIENDDPSLEINLEPLPTATIIPFQIKQLFINLLSNSLKFSKNNRNINISIKNPKIDESDLKDFPNTEPNELVKISIQDNGIGFDNTYSRDIFNSFTRLNSKKLFTGSGLGLAICKKIVDNHRGIIKAFGKLNRGATFVIIFPNSPA